jgi:hypothetical protein
MDARAMTPLGMALRSYLDGDARAELVIQRDDGVATHPSQGALFGRRLRHIPRSFE